VQPMAGIDERLCTDYLPLVDGWQVTRCADPDAGAAFLPEIRPEFFSARPALGERLRDSVLACFDGDPERAAADTAAVLVGLGLEQVRMAIVAVWCSPDVVGFWRTLAFHSTSRSSVHNDRDDHSRYRQGARHRLFPAAL
jgi:hypothetical protein